MAAYVYIFGSTRYSWYKIGRSIHPEKRLNALKNCVPFDVDFISTKFTTHARVLERELHERFKDQRLSGEWFRLKRDEVCQLVLEFEKMQIYHPKGRLTVAECDQRKQASIQKRAMRDISIWPGMSDFTCIASPLGVSMQTRE